MAKPDRTNKTTDKTIAEGEQQNVQAARERELRQLIEGVEHEKSGAARPAHESAHDYVERRMRETSKKASNKEFKKVFKKAFKKAFKK